MDLVSHAALAAACAGAAAKRAKLGAASAVAAVAGLAADSDTLIRSSADPLLLLETHRRFTHALPLVPLAALVVAGLLFYFVRRKLSFRETYAFALLGYTSHCLLDACTSYGTQLFWPFSDVRIAFSNIAVFDPLFTVPTLLLAVFAAVKKRKALAAGALLWASFYLSLGGVQHERALREGERVAASRGHEPVRIAAKPALASLLLWKVIYEHDGRYYVDGVRAGIHPKVYIGDSVEKLDVAKQFPWLDLGSQQARDLERFSRISDDLVAVARDDASRVIDVRYSMVPNEIDAFWAVELDPRADGTAHVGFEMTRERAPEQARRLLRMLFR
ncbi:MAG TPA: metal-dependent hydrolase [Gammaproteobacteria bacterium]|nr:metal-dependent hydrolase [Gammaproteobacteria bacterium]